MDKEAGAYLEPHVYPDGYGRRHLDKPFWIVHCEHPSHGHIVLNSAHHYSPAAKHFAEALIAGHDLEHSKES
jgi:hypothetical protein